MTVASGTNDVCVIVADDHVMFVEALCHLLAGSDRVRVAGTADNGDDLVALAERLEPDIALIDVSMPGPPSASLPAAFGCKSPATKLIALTMHRDLAFAETLIAAGYAGYVLKEAAFQELLAAIESVVAGSTFISTSLRDASQDRPRVNGPLTDREIECLRAAAEGLSNKRIARRYAISERTVKFHFENIFRKLGASNRVEAMAIGRRESLV